MFYKSLQVTVMIGIVIFSLSFMLILIVLKSIFGVSVLDYGLSSSISSENFECGFYTVLTSVLRYRVNYYATIIHYIFFEQELIIAFLLLFNYSSVVNEVLIVLLLSVLYIDCDLIITITYTNS